jgi:hypothetical protein
VRALYEQEDALLGRHLDAFTDDEHELPNRQVVWDQKLLHTPIVSVDGVSLASCCERLLTFFLSMSGTSERSAFSQMTCARLTSAAFSHANMQLGQPQYRDAIRVFGPDPLALSLALLCCFPRVDRAGNKNKPEKNHI